MHTSRVNLQKHSQHGPASLETLSQDTILDTLLDISTPRKLKTDIARLPLPRLTKRNLSKKVPFLGKLSAFLVNLNKMKNGAGKSYESRPSGFRFAILQLGCEHPCLFYPNPQDFVPSNENRLSISPAGVWFHVQKSDINMLDSEFAKMFADGCKSFASDLVNLKYSSSSVSTNLRLIDSINECGLALNSISRTLTQNPFKSVAVSRCY